MNILLVDYFFSTIKTIDIKKNIFQIACFSLHIQSLATHTKPKVDIK